MHKDSKSSAFESFKHFSSSLFNCTDKSDCRPASKCGAAKGFNSMFKFKTPSLGLEDFGCWISHETWAKTLNSVLVFSVVLKYDFFTYLVLPKDTWQEPQSFPKFILTGLNSSNALPSNL